MLWHEGREADLCCTMSKGLLYGHYGQTPLSAQCWFR